MNASGSPTGAASAAPMIRTALAVNKVDTARVRSEVDIVVPFMVWYANARGIH
jgi:hypothetical protein